MRHLSGEDSRHGRSQEDAAHGLRARDPARPLGPRTEHRARSARGAVGVAGQWLHDRPQAAPDHDGQGTRRSRRVPARARLLAAPLRAEDAARAARRSRGPGVRRLVREARAAGARRPPRDERGTTGHPGDARPARGRRREMNLALPTGPLAQAIGWALLHLVWQGALVAALLAFVLTLLSGRAASLRYSVSCAALALIVALGVVTGVRSYPGRIAERPAKLEAPPSSALLVLPSAVSPITVAAFTPARVDRLRDLARAADRALPAIVTFWLLGVALLT